MNYSAPAPRPELSDERLALTLQRDPTSFRGQDAFAQLYARGFPHLTAYLAAEFFIQPHASEDLVQTTFMKALAGIDRFDPVNGNWAGWLTIIARNTAVDEHRRQNRRPIPVADPQALLEDRLRDPNLEATPAFNAMIGELRDKISPLYIRALLESMAGVSHPEQSANEGIPVATAKSRLRLARRFAGRALLEAGLAPAT